MKHLAVDFGAILSKAGLPPVTLKEGNSMMSVISAFEHYYVEAEKSDLNLKTHMFGGSAIAVVMKAFRKYYRLVEETAVNMQQNEKVSSESSSPLQWLGSPPDLPKPTLSCLDTNLVPSISTSKSKKAKDIGIKKSIKGKKCSSTVGDITFTGSIDDSDQVSKKRKLTDDRIPDTQTMVQQLQKLDLSPSQMENVLKANRKGRYRLLLKMKEGP